MLSLLLVTLALLVVLIARDPLAQPSASAGAQLSNLHFAIADFDGDWKPDLAVIEARGFRRSQADYSVRLQFSASAELSFLVSGPSGGIRLAARDVNGDNLPDLVVSSVSDERVVAVLLNEGHGQFSQAEPSAYPGFGGDPGALLGSGEQPLWDKFSVVSSRYSFDGESLASVLNRAPAAADAVTARRASLPCLSGVRTQRGRSPPSGLLLA